MIGLLSPASQMERYRTKALDWCKDCKVKLADFGGRCLSCHEKIIEIKWEKEDEERRENR